MSFEYWLEWNYGMKLCDLTDNDYEVWYSRYEFENVE